MNQDILERIFNHIGFWDFLQLCAVCKSYNTIYKNIRATRPCAGNTILFPRQVKMLKLLTNRIDAVLAGNQNNVIDCNAYMSFGKTLIGLELALKYAAAGVSQIMIIGQIETVWKKEVKKYYPGMVGGRVTNRRILFDSSATVRNYITAASDVDLAGCIIITSKAIIYKNVKIIVIDEVHRDPKRVETALNCRVPIVLMGASANDIVADKITADTNSSIMPTITEDIIECQPEEVGTIAHQKITRSKGRHIILLAENIDMSKNIIASLHNIPSYDYTNRTQTSYKQFVKNGGVLYTTIRVIAEGQNFNICDHMFVIMPSTVSLRRVQQARGRINRTSGLRDEIRITYITCNVVGLGRAMLAHTASNGYELSNSINLPKIIHNILPYWNTLGDEELLLLIAYPDTATYSVTRGKRTLTLEQIYNLLQS